MMTEIKATPDNVDVKNEKDTMHSQEPRLMDDELIWAIRLFFCGSTSSEDEL